MPSLARRSGGAAFADEAEQGVKLGGGSRGSAGWLRIQGIAGGRCKGFVEGAEDAFAIEGLEQIVDGVDLKGADGVLIVGGGEDDLGQGGALLEQFLQHSEAVEAGHLDVEEDEVGLVGADEFDGFDAVDAGGENLGVGESSRRY